MRLLLGVDAVVVLGHRPMKIPTEVATE